MPLISTNLSNSVEAGYVKSDSQRHALSVRYARGAVFVGVRNFNGNGPTVTLTEPDDVERLIKAAKEAAAKAWSV